jgi:hypothetical protein
MRNLFPRQTLLVCFSVCLLSGGAVQAQTTSAPVPDSVLAGPAGVKTGEWVTYTAHVNNWPADHYWSVTGADSIVGVAAPPDRTGRREFQTASNKIRVRWAVPAEWESEGSGSARRTTVAAPPRTQGMVALRRAGSMGSPKTIATVTTTLWVAGTDCYHIKGNYSPSGWNVSGVSVSTRRDVGVTVCPNDVWVFSNSRPAKFHYFVVTYTSNLGNTRTLRFRETMGNSNFKHPAPGFIVQMNGSGPGSQPYWEVDDFLVTSGAIFWLGAGEATIKTKIQAISEQGADVSSLCLSANYSTDIEFTVGVEPLAYLSYPNPPATLCATQAVAPFVAGYSSSSTGVEWAWFDATTRQQLTTSAFTTPPPFANPMVYWNTTVPISLGGRRVTMGARAIRRTTGGSSCNAYGAWLYGPAFTITPVPGQPLSLTVSPGTVVTASVTPPAPVAGATVTGYRWTASAPILAGPTSAVSTLSGPAATVALNVPSASATPRTYTLTVAAVGACGAGTPISQTFTIGGTPTCPTTLVLDPTDLRVSSNPQVYFKNTNPFWDYSFFAINPLPVGSKNLRISSIINRLVNGQQERGVIIEFENAPSKPFPTSFQLLTNVSSGAGSGQLVTSCTNTVTVWCPTCPPQRPAPGGADTSEEPLGSAISLAPNPAGAQSVQVIANQTGNCRYAELYDLRGVRLRRVEAPTEIVTELTLPLDNVRPGLYVVRAFDGKRVSTVRLVRE